MKKIGCFLGLVCLIFLVFKVPVSATEKSEDLDFNIIWLDEMHKDDVIYSFFDGMAKFEIKKNNKEYIGFIDLSGKIAVPAIYDFAYDYSDGLALVTKGEKEWFIDKKGKVVIPLDQYENVSPFYEGLSSIEKNGKKGFIDTKGKVVIPIKYDSSFGFSEGLAYVGVEDAYGNRKFGFIDKTGKVVVPIKYNNVKDFKDGISLVNLNGKNFFINRKGEKTLTNLKNFSQVYSEGLFIVGSGIYEPMGVMDTTGKIIVPFNYLVIQEFYDGMANVTNDLKKNGFINKEGKLVIPMEYESHMFFSEGLGAVMKEVNGKPKWGAFDREGEIVIPFEFDFIQMFRDGVAPVYINGRWGLLKNPLEADEPMDSPENRPSKWAKISVEKAIQEGLVNKNLSKRFRMNISKESFCDLIISFYETLKNEPLEWINEPVFTDTNDLNVLKSFQLGIVSGDSKSRFFPYNYLTREEMCLMIEKLMSKFEVDINIINKDIIFKDDSKIATEAKNAMYKLFEMGIISCTEDQKINPKGYITREQAIVVMYKVYQMIK